MKIRETRVRKSGKCWLMVAVARGHTVLGAHTDAAAVAVVSAAVPATSFYQWLFIPNTTGTFLGQHFYISAMNYFLSETWQKKHSDTIRSCV